MKTFFAVSSVYAAVCFIHLWLDSWLWGDNLLPLCFIALSFVFFSVTAFKIK